MVVDGGLVVGGVVLGRAVDGLVVVGEMVVGLVVFNTVVDDLADVVACVVVTFTGVVVLVDAVDSVDISLVPVEAGASAVAVVVGIVPLEGEHTTPFPTYPFTHSHENPPSVLRHLAFFLSQLSVSSVHSSLSGESR